MANEAISGNSDAQSERPDDASSDTIANQGMQWLTEYGDRLYAYAIQRVSTPDLAEELVQDTFLAALRSASSANSTSKFNRESSEATWLTAILRRKIADYYRLKNRGRKRAESLENSETSAVDPGIHLTQWSDPSKAMHDKEFQAVLKECIFKLPDLMRQALLFRYFDDLSPKEISELQGNLPKQSCSPFVSRATIITGLPVQAMVLGWNGLIANRLLPKDETKKPSSFHSSCVRLRLNPRHVQVRDQNPNALLRGISPTERTGIGRKTKMGRPSRTFWSPALVQDLPTFEKAIESDRRSTANASPRAKDHDAARNPKPNRAANQKRQRIVRN